MTSETTKTLLLVLSFIAGAASAFWFIFEGVEVMFR